MKKVILTALILGLFVASVFACGKPPDTLNKYNDKHKKHGWWLIYLNNRLIQVKDKSKAFYYAFYYYDNGYCSVDGPHTGHKFASKAIGEQSVKGYPIPLNGNFKLYGKNGNLLITETCKNGVYIVREYYEYDRYGKCSDKIIAYWSKKYNNQQSSFYWEKYSYDTLVDKCYSVKNNEGKFENCVK